MIGTGPLRDPTHRNFQSSRPTCSNQGISLRAQFTKEIGGKLGRLQMRRGPFVIVIVLLLIPALIRLYSFAHADNVDAEFKALVTELDTRWNAHL
jgi:hypothetical protein